MVLVNAVVSVVLIKEMGPGIVQQMKSLVKFKEQPIIPLGAIPGGQSSKKHDIGICIMAKFDTRGLRSDHFSIKNENTHWVSLSSASARGSRPTLLR